MKEKVFNVSGMKCKHCVMTVTEAVSELDGVQSCDVNLEKGTATVKFEDSIDESSITSAIKEEGFGVA
ncbi:MAG: heavy-metal-associated domain-containing protein [Deferribacterales bacterium]